MFKRFRRKKENEELSREIAKSRSVKICGEISDNTATQTIASLLFLQSEGSRAPITLDINSPGGSVTASLAILDTMSVITCPVHTHCSGMASGTALNILAQGEKGYRTAFDLVELNIVQLYSKEMNVQERDVEIQTKEIERLREILIENLRGNTILSKAAFDEDFEDARKFDAESAIVYGFIDEILPQSLDKVNH
ncbi:MAG: ATP-dependent Clp protease proteolytic subunit [Lentisphaeraceae bacterium]|nr:ATP-dependent Clp protease proteolytic subunit [Lentisphaeraceae bacterium]